MQVCYINSVVIVCTFFRFFSEDGNFGQKEAKFYFKELKKLEATLEKNINILQIDIDPKYQKLKIIIHEKHSHLKLMYVAQYRNYYNVI